MSALSPLMLGTRHTRSRRTDDFHETPRVVVEGPEPAITPRHDQLEAHDAVLEAAR